MGVSYARTLRAWRVRFDAVEDQVKQLGFDDVFIRKWRYYLDYCEAGFACGHIDVKQIRLEKTDEIACRRSDGGRPRLEAHLGEGYDNQGREGRGHYGL